VPEGIGRGRRQKTWDRPAQFPAGTFPSRHATPLPSPRVSDFAPALLLETLVATTPLDRWQNFWLLQFKSFRLTEGSWCHFGVSGVLHAMEGAIAGNGCCPAFSGSPDIVAD
jgi:hypothetical protein